MDGPTLRSLVNLLKNIAFDTDWYLSDGRLVCRQWCGTVKTYAELPVDDSSWATEGFSVFLNIPGLAPALNPVCTRNGRLIVSLEGKELIIITADGLGQFKTQGLPWHATHQICAAPNNAGLSACYPITYSDINAAFFRTLRQLAKNCTHVIFSEFEVEGRNDYGSTRMTLLPNATGVVTSDKVLDTRVKGIDLYKILRPHTAHTWQVDFSYDGSKFKVEYVHRSPTEALPNQLPASVAFVIDTEV